MFSKDKIALAAMLLLIATTLTLRHPSVKQTETTATAADPRVKDVAPSVARVGIYEARDAAADVTLNELKAETPAKTALQKRTVIYKSLASKVLKTTRERVLWQTLLKDSKMHAAALEALSPKTPEDDRMTLVDYLVDAMRDQQESKSRELSAKIQNFLEDKNWSEVADKKLLKSLAGDRIELLISLMRIDPRTAKELNLESSTPVNQRVYQYASMKIKGLN